MNIKEIAELTGKTERSIRLWSTKASENISSISEKISYSSRTKKPSDFTLEETVEIIRSGGNETLANLLKENANRDKDTTKDDIMSLSKIISLTVSETIKSLLPYLVNNSEVKNNNVLKEPEKQLTFNDVPEKSKRAELREIINKYTAHRGCNHIEVWSQLYQQIYYRMNINVKLCADNRGMDKLDYIEKEGLLNEVLSLAKKLFEVK